MQLGQEVALSKTQKLETHIFVEEALYWVELPKEQAAYASHRINEEGTPAVPINQ